MGLWVIIGPPAKRHLNGVLLAYRWWPDIKCWIGSFVIFFRGSGQVFRGNPIFCDFSGGGVRTPCPYHLDPPMAIENSLHHKDYYKKLWLDCPEVFYPGESNLAENSAFACDFALWSSAFVIIEIWDYFNMAWHCFALSGKPLNSLIVQNYCNFRVFAFNVYTTCSPHSMVKFCVNCKQEPLWKWSLVMENATDTNKR